ncbi:MAG: ATP-binding protein [Bacillota bacterium]|nr:ATP-binding protein [Bacillota bacterium]
MKRDLGEEAVRKHYNISGTDFSVAGEASSDFKTLLKKLGIKPDIVRKVAIAMYEAEINTVVHGRGGECDAEVLDNCVKIVFTDHGPGIANVELAMQEGYSTASETIRELGFGAGMGLPNIKKYTDSMKIDTEVGKGTTVTLTVNL